MPDDGRPSFDLTSERWLPVRYRNGSKADLSLRQIFAEAREVRCLMGDVPTQEFALIRLLLAILHDALQGPADLQEWQELWDHGLPGDRIEDYLQCHRDHFDLLHPQRPFFQTPDLRAASGEVSSLDRLVADVPNGARFFTMRARGATRLTYGEAARWLVHAHAFDTSGIKTGAVGDPRAKGGRGYPQGVAWTGNLGGVMAEGESLHETLLLNLIAFDTPNLHAEPQHDLPAWRRPPTGPQAIDQADMADRPAGPRDLYTWQSRRIRLHADTEGVTSVILAYGDPLSPRNMHLHEPMTSWRRSPEQEKKLAMAQVYLPREHDPDRSAWRGLGALVAGRVGGAEQRREAAAIVRPRILDWVARMTVEGDLPADFLIRARLFGQVYGTQQSVVDEIVNDAVAMPVILLHEQDQGLGQTAIDAAADADHAVALIGDLAADLARAAGTAADGPKGKARLAGYAALDGPFRNWLAALRPDDNPHEQRATWQLKAHRIISAVGDDLLRSAPDAAWQGRVITTRQGTELWLTASRADLTCRTGLNRALPLASAPTTGAPA
ncbi:type I-E CRISPR-associated protein Cse1/CasA [Nonomuraea endophytica]|uniref:CRISPR system Cascade subunit CasA n=1 Tax=Nonomuraea endophytica TaxID=714136 RepID=A0A7W8AH94_9ACTN|nr:type I-E CRISPR-associated protein Cse1/CasA [Nonomuraea endophytica]MBB5085071.1 CRISPR system Cascade subunit CasA [Nonomuraea endophytica]